jgi:hypothetical protein
MFGWVATACRRLASAPGDGTTWRVAGCVMECVSRGRVRRVQVQPQRRAYCAERVCDVTDQHDVAAAEEIYNSLHHPS